MVVSMMSHLMLPVLLMLARSSSSRTWVDTSHSLDSPSHFLPVREMTRAFALAVSSLVMPLMLPPQPRRSSPRPTALTTLAVDTTAKVATLAIAPLLNPTSTVDTVVTVANKATVASLEVVMVASSRTLATAMATTVDTATAMLDTVDSQEVVTAASKATAVATVVNKAMVANKATTATNTEAANTVVADTVADTDLIDHYPLISKLSDLADQIHF